MASFANSRRLSSASSLAPRDLAKVVVVDTILKVGRFDVGAYESGGSRRPSRLRASANGFASNDSASRRGSAKISRTAAVVS